MATAQPRPLDRQPPPPGKRGFVKRVAGFANRAWALPGFPGLWIAGAAAAALMTLVGGFNTGALPLGMRAGFWALLMAWCTLKWQIWFALTVRRPRDWTWSGLLSIVPLGLPLPYEIATAAWLVGVRGASWPHPYDTWGKALAMGLLVCAVCSLAGWRVYHMQSAALAAPPPPDGLLDRARTESAMLAAIEAEDHYCRVRRTDGSSALLLYRFGDALGEVGSIDGAQVHRGSWVAAAAVKGAERDGRRWRLVLADGSRVAVSATHVAEARRRGWLRPA
jgi:hypothetical protein